MKAEINQEILNKIEGSAASKNVKELIYELLEFEYEHIDESNPRFKDTYVKAIKKWK